MKEKQIIRVSIFIVGIICVTVLLYGLFISPTRFKYDKLQTQNGEILIKINRLTGEVHRYVNGIWYSSKEFVDNKIEAILNEISTFKKAIETCKKINNDSELYEDMLKYYKKYSLKKHIEQSHFFDDQSFTVTNLDKSSKATNKLIIELPPITYSTLYEAIESGKSLKEALIDVVSLCEEKIVDYEKEINTIKKYN